MYLKLISLFILGSVIIKASETVENDLEEYNLNGKIRSISEFEADIFNKNSQRKLKNQLNFNRSGYLTREINYSNDETIAFELKRTYNSNKIINETIKDNVIGHESISSNKYDLNGLLIESIGIYNGVDSLITKFSYNKQSHRKEIFVVFNNDTSLIEFDYRYNDEGRIIYKEQITKPPKQFQNRKEYLKYDSLGNGIEQVVIMYMGNDSLVNTSKIEYHPNGKVKKNIFYYNSELQTIMIYNTKGDQIEIKHFVNGEVSVIESFDYDYDNKQNWILKTVSQKYFSNENGDFNQVKRVERDIDYYGCFSILNLF